jgi:diketogulonate reductase-like aldo/keto reductase
MGKRRHMTSRREFLGATAATIGLSAAGTDVLAQTSMPRRAIPSTGEALPIIGLGSSKVVSEIATRGTGPLAAVLRTLVEHGGTFMDTWPRDPRNDAGVGEVINLPDLRDVLFVTTKVDQVGREAGIAQFRGALENYQRSELDLTQIFSLTDLDTHWPSLREWKEEGLTRYIGVTVSEARRYDQLEAFLARETPDFIQVNYSITERLAEERIIPLASDKGIAIVINRPFMNGAYFDRLEGVSLPSWAEEFECETWAQFSLKYILANPLPTCILTETSNPVHMAENALTASGPTPNEQQRARMRAYIDSV